MTLILGDVRPHRWQFGDWITENIFHHGGLFELPRQKVSAVAAIGWQCRNDLIDALRRH